MEFFVTGVTLAGDVVQLGVVESNDEALALINDVDQTRYSSLSVNGEIVAVVEVKSWEPVPGYSETIKPSDKPLRKPN